MSSRRASSSTTEEGVPPDDTITRRVFAEIDSFFKSHPHIKSSHGLSHARAVWYHAARAISCAGATPLSATESMEVQVAALLHDVDDKKYFPDVASEGGGSDGSDGSERSAAAVSPAGEEPAATARKTRSSLPNAGGICDAAGVPPESADRILAMIGWVSCSDNGNAVPPEVASTGSYHMLIPRWADRLEAVGAAGVARCYRYSLETGRPLFTEASPRARSEEEVWRLATPERFGAYLSGGGGGGDMISHYYDKLLHVARPPPESVRNPYLEKCAEGSAGVLIEVCLRFGRTGTVDEGHIRDIEMSLEDGKR